MSQAPPAGKLARSAVAARALGQLGLAHAAHQVRALLGATGALSATGTPAASPSPSPAAAADAAAEMHDAKLGRILFRALNQLKGTALKLAQMLGTYADFLPDGVRRELGAACYAVTPLNRALVHKVFRTEFGCDAHTLFDRFDADAFAAASLGQVHRASLADGSALAVKVQYPGIAAAIGSDLHMLRLLVGALGTRAALPAPGLVDQIMDDIARKLAEELDYEHEAAQLLWFRAHATLAGIVIPAPVLSHSSKRVLSMQHLAGLHLDAWLATEPTQSERNRYGQLLFDWHLHSMFELGRIQADPHVGNVLFLADGRLGLLDFGCTRTLAPDFGARLCTSWHALGQLLAGGPSEPARLAYVALGLVDAALGQHEFERMLVPALAASAAWMLAPFRAERYDFATLPAFPPVQADHARTLSRYMVGIDPDLPYADRAYLGMLQIQKRLGAVVNTGNAWITLTE